MTTKRKAVSVALALLVIAAAFGAAYIGARMGRQGREPATEEKTLLDAGRGIIIPGYDVLQFSAGQKDQKAYFYNPPENKCFFMLSLIVDDTELYTSPMICPGTKIEDITLAKKLAAGIYEGKLMYHCYDLYTQRAMNDAEMPVKLEVKQ